MSSPKLFSLLVCAAIVILASARCGGPSSQVSAPLLPTGAPNATNVTKVNVPFVVHVPRRSQSARAHPTYMSAATQSMLVRVLKSDQSEVLRQVVDLTPSSPACGSVPDGLSCIVNLELVPGTYTFAATMFSGTSGTGDILSENQRAAFTVKPGAANVVSLAFYGVPASLSVQGSDPALKGTQSTGFKVSGGMSPQTLVVVAKDASGEIIVGPGAPTFSAASSSNLFAIATPPPNSPNVFTITPPSTLQNVSTTITISAVAGDSDACTTTSAVCSTNTSLTYAPFDDDDWITFAHDFARTGRQSQATGITPQTVSQLQPRWKIQLPYGEPVYGSPIVYNGNVIVNGWWGNVYDLAAADGHTLWETTIGGYPNMQTPTIDTNDGLVFVANRNTPTIDNTITPLPSQLYALRLSDGLALWNVTMPGPIRAAPVYANGTVYEGSAGGDGPFCINGGVNAYNALTGALEWKWLVNPSNPSNGGGAVWGAIAYDGQRLVFGTGNTCQGDIGTAQGAVSLDPNTGSQNWSFAANAASDEDDDTGGGVMLQNGLATFINKNGTLYSLSAQTGVQQMAAALGAPDGLGGHASPGSDGAVYLIGAGLFPMDSSPMSKPQICWLAPRAQSSRGRRRPAELVPGYTSKLDAVNANGQILWSIPMTSRITGYVAVTGQIAFAGMDSQIDAIDIQSGAVLWNFRSSSSAVFDASPVVVPSGLYAADELGNVYAFAIPGSTANAQSIKRNGRTN